MAIPAHLNDHPVFNGSPWGAMSGEAPRFHAEEQPTHENLVNHLRQRGVKFEETHGRYGDPERSVLIYKPTRELMSELGKKFGQESVVYSNGGKHELLYTNGEHEGKSRLTSPGNEPITWHDEAPDDYYSHLPNHGYFTINFDFDRDPEFQGPAPVCPECRTATKGDFCHQCGARQWSGPAPVQKSEAFARSPIMRLKKAWPRDEKENQANAASHAVMEDAILEQGGTKQKHPLRWEAVDPMARANVSPSAAGSSWGTPEAQAGQGWNRCRSCGTDFEMNDPHHTLCPDCDTHFDEEGVTPELVPYFTAQEPAVPWDREFAEGDKVAQAAEQSYWSNVGASTDREARFATAFPALSSSSWQNANQIPTKAEMQSAYERSPIFNKKLKKANPPHELNQVLADQLQEQGFKPAEVPNSVGIRGTQSYRGREANRSWSPDWREAIAQRTEQQFNRLTRPNEGTAHLTVDPEDAGYFAERQAIYDIGAAHLSRDKDDPNFGGKDAHFHNMPGVRDADDLGPELNREVGLPHPHAYEWHDGHTDHHVTAPNPTLVKGVSNPQKLDKMAIADLRPSEHPAKNEQGQNVFNYSHLLSPDQQNAGYRMHLVHEKRSGTHELTAEIYHNHGFVGDLSGYSMMPMRHGEVPELDVVTADIPGTDHHNKGLGRALYEALYAHAYHHLGARRVNGDRHSSMAHRVHVSLAKKHGLEYIGRERATTRPRGPFDGRFGPYSYALKSELAKNAQVAPAGVPTYSQFAGAYGTIQPGQSNLMHYPYHGKSSEVAELVKRHGYRTYFAGGKYGKPDLQAKNYNTGHLMIYDPTPQSGGDFHDHQYTSAWRQMHELAHALTLKDVNDLYGEGRRMGKLGTHRSSNEALRAVHWEWLAAHKQRELNTQIGIHVPDETFHKELNTVMHDAVHRAVTGKFTEPSSEGFAPHSYKVPLHIALDTVRQHAEGMGLKNPHAKLQKAVPSEPPLSLELVCGQTGVDPEHPGYWEGPGGESLYHPKHQEVHDRLKAHGIRVDLSSHEDDGMYFSDAYVKFHPHQIGHVVDALRASRHPGDILDFKARLAPKHDQAVRAVARREGWSVGNDIQKGWPKDEKENQANAASHAVMEDAWLEQGAKKTVHRGFVQDLRDRASWASSVRTNAVRNTNDELRHQNVPAGIVPAMPANYSFEGTGYDNESFGTINNWNENYSNPYPRTNDQKYWQNIDKESDPMAKARPPQEVNQVLADQLQEQGFKPTKGYTTKQGLGTRLNAVKINHPPELPARGVGETLAPWERRRVDQIGRGAPGEIAEILDQRYAPYDDSSGELQWATRDPGRLEPAQWDAPQFNPKALTAKVYDKQYWQQVSEGYPKNLGPDPEPAATAAQIPTKTEMQTAWQRSPLFKRKGQ